jgi:hypothetical protein
VEKYKAGLESTINNKTLSTDLAGRWMRRIMNISMKALQWVATFLEEMADKEGEPLKFLRNMLTELLSWCSWWRSSSLSFAKPT